MNNVLDDEIGFVHLVDNKNDDLTVVNAARVSFNKTSDHFTTYDELEKGSDEGLVNFLADHNHWTPFSHIQVLKLRKMSIIEYVMWTSETQDMQFNRAIIKCDDKTVHFLERGSFYSYITAGEQPSSLLNTYYSTKAFSGIVLMTCKFGSILRDLSDCVFDKDKFREFLRVEGITYSFEFDKLQCVTLRYKMPIFVARQWFKHMIGLTRNEVSRRYINSDPEFFIPDTFRLNAENVKQGSSSETIKEFAFDKHLPPLLLQDIVTGISVSNNADYHLLNKDANICAEQSRIILPQNMYTEFYETGTLDSYNRISKLRCEKTTQFETQLYAQSVMKLVKE